MRIRRTLFGCLVALLLASGCAGKQGLPPDPLFADRKPTETKVQTGPPVVTPFAEPAPAPNRYIADPSPFSARVSPDTR